ncbi:four-helix bundle copper-binding protein [Halobacteriales archaeon Cl-PHB]
MSQQYQTQQQPQQRQQGPYQGYRLSDVQSPQERQALDVIQHAIATAEWCADQCIEEANPGMVECIRQCEDVSEIGEAALTLVPRKSRQSSAILSTFQQTAQSCAQECVQHDRAHCQECSQVLQQAAQAASQLLQGGQQGMGQGQPGPQQSGGQFGQPQFEG